MIVSAPVDEGELQNLLYTAINANHPMAIRFPRGYGIGAKLNEKYLELPIGKGEILQKGEDVAIIAIGTAIAPSFEAAEILEKEGITCTIVNARFVKPLDAELLTKVVTDSKLVVTVEENVLDGGFGSSVSSLLHDQGLADIKLVRIGLPDQFIEHGTQKQLRSKYKLSADEIAKRIKDTLS
jgi:1-deoxy-D-xylulose-5-phosphate synthase